MAELKLTPSAVVKAAKDKGCKIDCASLSKYLNKPNETGGISDEAIIFLAVMYGININLVVGTLTINNGKLDISLPEYNELESLKQLKTIFGDAEHIKD